MGAVVSGIMVMISAAMVLAIITGGICGLVNGRLRGKLFTGLFLAAGVYVGAAYVLDLFSVLKAGILPLVVTFLVPNMTVPYLEDRRGLKPAVSILAGLATVIITGALFLFLFATRNYPFSASLWITSALVGSLLLYRMWRLWRPSKSIHDNPRI